MSKDFMSNDLEQIRAEIGRGAANASHHISAMIPACISNIKTQMSHVERVQNREEPSTEQGRGVR